MDVNLSVIIPMYNVEKYIEQCIESLLKQSVVNLEIIIVNDGSTDTSYSKALRYQQKFSEKIKLLTQTNNGQSSARNLGLSKAKGNYIAFVDADDFIDKDMYEKMILCAEKYQLDIVQCNYLNWYGSDSDRNHEYLFSANENQVYLGKEYFEYEPSLSPCDKIFRKDFLNNMKFSFEEGRYAEDVLEISKAFYYAERVMYINEVLYFYRRESFNSTRNSIDLNKSIKLSVDKIYISYKLNLFCKEKKWNGVVRRIVVRNIIGAIMNKEIKKRLYRKIILKELIKRKSLVILIVNLKINDIKSYTMIGVNKFFLKR